MVNTPPADRQPILTYVGEQDEPAVAEALRRELLREGQVFYVHNRVQDIEHVAAGLRNLVPEARVAIAHGQMDEGTLEKVVLDFWEGAYDVLVCTTIIESGIDMPSVNTLVVDRADLLGLGQLHQIRGRVGRAGRRAYAYSLPPATGSCPSRPTSGCAPSASTPSSAPGFKIAMRDLEIRGAGNLLGRDQSGHIAAVGYDLYVQLVAEAVAEFKGEPIRVPVEITIDLPVDAHLARRLRRARGPAPRGLPAAGRVRTTAQSRTCAPNGPTATDRCPRRPRPSWPSAACGPSASERASPRWTASVTRPGSGGPGRTGEAVARLSPLHLRASARVRLGRLHPWAIAQRRG